MFTVYFARLLDSFNDMSSMPDKIQAFALDFVYLGAIAVVLFFGTAAVMQSG